MRLVLILAVAAFGCGPSDRRTGATDSQPADACTGLECRIVNCAKQGKPPTSISGKVFAPNGTLALYGVTVYVPVSDPGPLVEGAECTRCVDELPGGSYATASTDEAGQFTLLNVPTGRNIPIVMQIGKWRRRVDVFEVNECTDNVVPPEISRLPRNKDEGDIPKIAIATGNCDALECLIRKVGVDASEFTSELGNGRVNLFTSNGASRSTADVNVFTPASTLWSDLDKLKKYDITLHSCECTELAGQKTQAMMDNLKAYADFGGRVFLSHYHHVWIAGELGVPTHAPAVWPSIATCTADNFAVGSDLIDIVSNPKGVSFANWMVNVGGSTTLGVIPISEGRQTCTTVDLTKAERWVYFPEGANEFPQNFQFTTPNEVEPENRCGKVVFSDMHVASGSTSSPSVQFPQGCSIGNLSPQEKALAFMLFDISTCIGPLF